MFLTLTQFLECFPSIELTKEEFVDRFIITYANRPTLKQLFQLKSVIKSTNDSRYQQREAIIDYFYKIIIVKRHQYLTQFYISYFELPKFYQLKWDHVAIESNINQNIHQTLASNDWLNLQQQYINQSTDQITESLMQKFNHIIDQPLSNLSLQKNDLSRKIIRNLNYLDILHLTRVTNTCKSKTSFWQTLLNVYNGLELEDRFFAPSSIGLFLKVKPSAPQEINYNNFFYLFQQYQPKASILNPYTINWILKHLLTGKKLLTPVLSWTSYLLAFMHSDWESYVGIDVLPSVCDRCRFLFQYYQTTLKSQLTSQTEINRLNHKQLDLYCQPSESLLYNNEFLNRYYQYFDAILLCPPYFDMEIYPTEGSHSQQSIDLYPNYQQWLNCYWEDTMALSFLVLKPGQKLAFIINNYVSLKGDNYPLIQDLNRIALKYFKLIDIFNLVNRTSPLRVNHKKRTEMLFIYQKDNI